MFGIIINSNLSPMSGHKFHDSIVMQTRNILPGIHVLFVYWKKQNVNEMHTFLPLENCAGRKQCFIKFKQFFTIL